MAVYLHWNYACRAKLLDDSADKAVFRAFKNRVCIAQALYLAAALMCFVNTYPSVAVTISIQLNYALALFFSPKGGPNKEVELVDE
ncbi:MAG: hypothetical protein ABI999_08200 [Acidobacteriota bacterium]